jgi:early secretory antigenic target protein ESAT-6
MGKVKVDFHAMVQAAEDIASCHRALVAEKDDLDRFLNTLRGTWGGAASGQWNKAQQDWTGACDEVNGILWHLYQALEVALANYRQTERYLEQLWGG